MTKPIYLDYAAATPLDPEVLLAMTPYFTEQFYNPSATYIAARSTRQAVEQARAAVAGWLGARPAEIIFTSGATEANNLAILGVAAKHPEGEILVSAIEHESVIAPAQKADAKLIPVSTGGIVDIDHLAKNINEKTLLISVMLVNNELGSVQPLREIAKLVEQTRKSRQRAGNKLPIYLHTDAAQAGNFFDLHVSRLGVDLMSINGGKIYGPKQSGALYVRAGVQLEPLILGGGQEFNIRSGTENVAGIIGLVRALDIAQKNREEESQRITGLRHSMENEIAEIYSAAVINGSKKHRAPHILSVSFPGRDNERLMMELDERGIQAAVGSACSADSVEPSHVLSAIGLDGPEARATLRFSLGRQTKQKDITTAVQLLASIL
ncbi:MAG: Aminotransferase [Candidatus Saccharibacteria bacterium]|nr:Aminotransferase [Candidatus Saccharibacteria bacterium]